MTENHANQMPGFKAHSRIKYDRTHKKSDHPCSGVEVERSLITFP